MEPDSRRSESIGRLSCLSSGARESCESRMTGQFISLAKSFMFLESALISCCLLSVLPSKVISCR